ncbi:MAG TPA: FAD-binding protein, partial [Agriterribacter sp.]|nr:FAD-binding protein [Agriterribacter sp.]
MAIAHQETLAGWGNYPTAHSYVTTPANAQELRAVITAGPVIARGLGRSYGDQAIHSGKKVCVCTKMHHFISWDEKEGILVCEAGTSLDEIISTFAPGGWMPMI